MTDKAKLLATRQSDKIKDKLPIWNMIYNAYTGGKAFITKDNLFQYRIEDNYRFQKRLDRADYTNHTQQLIDMMVGFVYSNTPKRDIEEKYSYITDTIYKGKTLQSLMNMVATNCLKSTVGILIDAPADTPETEAERMQSGMNPYAVYYAPSQIRDFEVDDNGELLWIILDNSYMDKTDPAADPEMKDIKRLWTRSFYQDVETVKKGDKETYILGEEIPNTLETIPFIFVNCRDNDSDLICDSPFEDIVIKSRLVFNIASWASEVLASSSFQLIFFPYDSQQDLEAITATFDPASGGMADLPVVPFKATSQAPFFAGPDIDMDKFINMINHLSEEILSKFGMKKESKGSWESGVAKSIDFEKTEAFLKSLSLQLQECERKIVEYCGLYENKEINAKIDYHFTYEKADIDKQLNRLAMAFTIPSQNTQRKAYKEMVKLTFPDAEGDEIDLLVSDINSGNPDLKTGNQSEDFKQEK
ncbi:MAG: hypothetical protein CVV49_08875 [Spirochaetae bacterium HGW-Spirochaetae-5]|nr:MAG: hypothetical protein CVV49_08875 [Spirochaetae bacterium HGW-Spirochaetae-5]